MNEHDESKCACEWCVYQRGLKFSHDEQHAHLHEWPEPDVVLGEE